MTSPFCAMLPTLLAIMGSVPFRLHGDIDQHILMDTIHSARELVHELRYGDARRDWLRKLSRKYGETDPFAAYGPLELPVDELLLELVDEHRSLDRGPSPYLEKWMRRLVPDLRYGDRIDFISADDDQAVERRRGLGRLGH